MKMRILGIVCLFFVSVSAEDDAMADKILKAFENEENGVVMELLKSHPDYATKIYEGQLNLLHYAAYFGMADVADQLLDQGVAIDLKDTRKRTPLYFAIAQGHMPVAKKLMDAGADVQALDERGNPLIFQAVQGSSLEMVKLLLANGAVLDVVTERNETPFLWAARGGNTDIMDFLISHCADPKHVGKNGFTALHWATLHNKTDAIPYLLEKGLDINAVDKRHRTPLSIAVDFSRKEATEALIQNSADVNFADGDGMTALLMAIKKGETELANLLIEKRASCTAKDGHFGKTSLHEAALRGYSDIAEMLLDQGIDPNIKDNHGHTALSYALKYGHENTAKLLRTRGGQESGWAKNLGFSPLLRKSLNDGEALVWYLKHSGWAIKTKSRLLIFDYSDEDKCPEQKLLANGHINLEEIKGLDVWVFVTHRHGDHFDKEILDWKKSMPEIHYVFGFEDASDVGAVHMNPRETKSFEGMQVTTIKSNDAGVGFAVSVDGVSLFHAGDHANGEIEGPSDFFDEFDFLEENGIQADIAFFLNLYGCGSSRPEAFQRGIFYALDKLKSRIVFPMHAANREWVYGDLVKAAEARNANVTVGLAGNSGDHFKYQNGTLTSF